MKSFPKYDFLKYFLEYHAFKLRDRSSLIYFSVQNMYHEVLCVHMKKEERGDACVNCNAWNNNFVYGNDNKLITNGLIFPKLTPCLGLGKYTCWYKY